jgi:hypothetical protein
MKRKEILQRREDREVKEIAPAIAGVSKVIGGAAKAASNVVAGAAKTAIATTNPQATQGKVEKVSGDQVTIKTPDGSAVTTNKSTLQQDEKGHLILNKSALNTPQGQEKPLTPGTQVQVTNSIAHDNSDIKHILKLSRI